ncbi:hypothetical protein [Shouchella miscanthi]|uniref:Uncharacterized protein n=1 Tax=Shouchella miscanthi TaxID=2598861 RepID=A0ABU6NNR9_9BACI|nr:hypothetical protein [Shouchella miscanthi]
MTNKEITIYQIFCGTGLFIFLLLSHEINSIIIKKLLSNQILFVSANNIHIIINLTFVLILLLLENKKKDAFLMKVDNKKYLTLPWCCFFIFSLGLTFVLVSLNLFNKTAVLILVSLMSIFIYYPVFTTLRFFLFNKRNNLSNNRNSLIAAYIALIIIVFLI